MKRKEENLGVTFTGSVTFNGPMFDIHDNEHVHIDMEGVSTSSKSQGGVKEMNPEQLARAIENCGGILHLS